MISTASLVSFERRYERSQLSLDQTKDSQIHRSHIAALLPVAVLMPPNLTVAWLGEYDKAAQMVILMLHDKREDKRPTHPAMYLTFLPSLWALAHLLCVARELGEEAEVGGGAGSASGQ